MVRIDLGEESAPNLKLDTLVTWAAPANIQLVANSENHFVSAYFSQEEFRNHRVWPHSLIEVPFREGWKLPITLYSDSSSRVIEPRLVQLSGRRAISWKSQRLDDKTERLVTLDSTGRLIASTDTLRRNDHFDLVRVESDRLVWAARGNHERGGLKLFIEDGLRIRKIADIDLPFKNPAPVVAVLPNSVLLAITTGLLPSEDGVISETYISKVNLRCR